MIEALALSPPASVHVLVAPYDPGLLGEKLCEPLKPEIDPAGPDGEVKLTVQDDAFEEPQSTVNTSRGALEGDDWVIVGDGCVHTCCVVAQLLHTCLVP